MAKNGENHAVFEKKCQSHGKTLQKQGNKLAVNSLNTRVQSPYSHFLAFATIITWDFHLLNFDAEGNLRYIDWQSILSQPNFLQK